MSKDNLAIWLEQADRDAERAKVAAEKACGVAKTAPAASSHGVEDGPLQFATEAGHAARRATQAALRAAGSASRDDTEGVRVHATGAHAEADYAEATCRKAVAAASPPKTWAEMTLRERAVSKRADADSAEKSLQEAIETFSDAQDYVDEARAEAEAAEKFADEEERV